MILAAGCGPTAETQRQDPAASSMPVGTLIPITTTSPQAREHLLRALDLMANVHMREAAGELEQALQLDPNFVQARALHGQAIGGSQGAAEIEQAISQATGLPDAERLLIEALANAVRGQQAQNVELAQRLIAAAPGDWRAFEYLGLAQLQQQKYAEAAEAFRRVTDLNPKIGAGYNMLGYARLQQGDLNAAIDAFRQYTSVAPTEANAQDSLADALMTAGRFEESEAAFRKALELDPQFSSAWEGVAYTKFFRGDWAQGRDAVAKALALAQRPVDKIDLYRLQSTAALSAGNGGEALRTLDDAARIPGLQPAELVLLKLQQARTLIEIGRPEDAQPIIDAALEQANRGDIVPGIARTVRRQALVARTLAYAAVKDAVKATNTARQLEAEATANADDLNLRSAASFSTAIAAMSRNDYASARKELAGCLREDYYCRYQQVIAAERAQDGAAADAARSALLATYRRSVVYLLVRNRLEGSAGRQHIGNPRKRGEAPS